MLAPGDTLGGFEILEVIGEGGMGTVYKALQVSLERVVALKVLSPHLITAPEDIERFRLESRAAANLKHSCIVEVYDAGEIEGLYYFAMAFVDGTSIDDWMEELEVIPEEETLVAVQCVASALEYAWDTARIIHRDIKPENVLVDSDGAIKLVDLGVIKMAGVVGDTKTAHDEIYGTPYYCSPEQATGEELDCRSDIYSLGAMMYHMLTGQLPFGDVVGTGALVKHVTEFLPDPRTINPAVSAAAAALVARMMVKERDKRHMDWSAVLADIKRVIKGKMPANPLPAGSEVSTVKLEAIQKSAGGKKIVYKKKTGIRTGGIRKTGAVRSAKVNASVRNVRAQQQCVSRSQGPSAAPIIVVIILVILAVIVGYFLWSGSRPSGGSRTTYQPRRAPRPRPERRTTSGRSSNQKTVTLELAPNVNLEIMQIPAGEFMMGSIRKDEGPVHRVVISKGFWMGKTEVTQIQYEALMGETPSTTQGTNIPVNAVNWLNATDFCRKLKKKLGNGKLKGKTVRLPTEAEWEYACRAKTSAQYNLGNGEAALSRAGWWSGNAGSKSHSVGQKQANAWGLYDMHGNVAEWCNDKYDKDYYGLSPRTDPPGPPADTQAADRILRGGHSKERAGRCSSTYRGHGNQKTGLTRAGFRIVVQSAP